MYNWLLAFGGPCFALLQQTLENAMSRHVFSTEDRLLCQQKLQFRLRSRDTVVPPLERAWTISSRDACRDRHQLIM